MIDTRDEAHMRSALALAGQAMAAGEVPVGAVVVRNGVVIGNGRNSPIGDHDPSAHAEVQALRAAAQAVGNYRLDDCELLVTLEPCAMCAGAILNARVKRLVYGAADPRAGAAGSVLDLFADPRLNHQTRVLPGVLAEPCGAILRDFFQARRVAAQAASIPLREDALRTPDARFDDLPDYPWRPHHVQDLPTLAGLRMHYLDEGLDSSRAGQQITWLCLHGNPAWSFLYRKMIPEFLAAGHRVVAPDLIGFGKSDKPKRDDFHRFNWHRQTLLELVERLDLNRIVLVVQDWGGLLGLTLPMARPERYTGLLVMNTTLATGAAPLSPGFVAWRDMCAKNPEFDIARLFARGNPHLSPAECAAYMAPFPDRGHRAATRAFPALVPEFPDSDGAAISREAQAFWQSRWTGQTLMAIGAQDPVLGQPVMRALRDTIRNCPDAMIVEQAGHFVQEHGTAIARAAVGYFRL